MRRRIHSLSLESLSRQRDCLWIAVCFLGTANLLLSFKAFWSSERVVVVPAGLSKSFWVEDSHVSSAYLEEMALFFARQILDVSPASAAYQRQVVLRYTAPSFHNALQKRLISEEEEARKNQLSTSFKPVSVTVYLKERAVELTGDLVAYVGGTLSRQTREVYRLTFSVNQGRLWVTGFGVQKGGADVPSAF